MRANIKVLDFQKWKMLSYNIDDFKAWSALVLPDWQLSDCFKHYNLDNVFK